MNTNKQLTKGNKMKKIAMVIGILSVLATSANAGSWSHTPYSDTEARNLQCYDGNSK